MSWLDDLSWGILLFLCATLGLAPFHPPHIWEKLQMLAAGRLVRPIDLFDLLLHSAPFLLLALKGVRTLWP